MVSDDAAGDWLTPERNFARFAPAIGLPGEETLTREALCGPSFLLYAGGGMTISYAPFDDVNREARVALVGITPGWGETRIAFDVAARGLEVGVAPERILREVKRQASFAGSMRCNLVQMLDAIGLAARLGLWSCDQLYTPEYEHLLHNTAALRYPVFAGGRNYTGHGPTIMEHNVLQAMAVRILAPELAAVSKALVIPLGVAVERALLFLAREDLLDACRCLFGFPHPSGRNGHRARQFAAHREELSVRVDEWFET
jgi:hypothetical protein